MKSISAWRTKLLLVCSGVFLVGASFLIGDLNGITVTGNETYTNPNELLIINSTVEPGGSLTLKAGSKIRLGPGFHAKAGSELSARIDPSLSGMVITNVPPTTGNDRFLDEIYPQMKRPGLSVIGFDNGGDNSNGLGLRIPS